MSDLDRKLLNSHLTEGYSESEWHEILHYAVAKLEEFLEQPIAVNCEVYDQDGFGCDIASEHSYGGRLEFSWFGRLAVTVVGDKEATVLYARILLRAFSKRLVTIDGGSYLHLTYEELNEGEFGWTSPMWSIDAYREYEDWT